MHVLIMNLLCMNAGVMHAAQAACPQPRPDIFEQQSAVVRQTIAEMASDDILDNLAQAYTNDPILQHVKKERLLKYWAHPHIKPHPIVYFEIEKGHSPAFSPDSNYLAYVSTAGPVTDLRLLFVPTGFSIPIPHELAGADNFAFSPDTNILAVLVNGCAKLWDFRTNQVNSLEPLCGQEQSKALSLAFSPNGVLATGHTNAIRFWDVERHIELPPLKSDEIENVSKISFSQDGKLLATASSAGSHKTKINIIWDVENRKRIEAYFGDLIFASKADIMAISSRSDTLDIRSFNKDVTPITFSLLWSKYILGLYNAAINDIALSPDGIIVAAGLRNGAILLFDAQNGNLLRTFFSGQFHSCLSFAPNGKALAIVGEVEVQLLYAEK